MRSEHGRGREAQRAEQPQPGRLREMLGEFPAIRQVFHALCTLEEGEDATELLDFAARQEWKTKIRRDYITSLSHVYDFDAFSSFSRLRPLRLADDSAQQMPLTADQASFVKNRCQFRADNEPRFFDYMDYGVDERRH